MSVPARAVVIVPWFGNGNALRERNYHAVYAHLDRSGFRGQIIPSSCTPWSPGRARNIGARGSAEPVIVFNDADTVVHAEQMRRMVRLAADEPGLVYGYDLYARLDASTSERCVGLLRDFVPAYPSGEVVFPAASVGCVAISRDAFLETGGFPEWEGWGYDGVAFGSRCQELWPLRRVGGPAFHLWHGERDRATGAPADSDYAEVVAQVVANPRSVST